MSDEQRYTPISCEVYSRLELHCMHKDTLRMQWRGDQTIIHIKPISPYDLKAVKGQGEFLYALDEQGNHVSIRLDRIIDFTPLP